MNARLRVGLLVLFCVVFSQPGYSWAIGWTTTTGRSVYGPGEPVWIYVTGANYGDEDVTLHFNSSIQAVYILDGYVWPRIGLWVLTEVLIPAQGSYTWEFRHNPAEYYLDPGRHWVCGGVGIAGFGSVTYFDVIVPPMPQEDFVIDFEHFPSGAPSEPAGLADVYAPWGVRFSSLGVSHAPALRVSPDNAYADVRSCTYPPGHNIVADFDMPVYSVAADISSAVDMTVTMVARDSGGRVIGSVTSPPVPEHGGFVGPIELVATTPIASVEWWPSDDSAGVMIDDLHIGLFQPLISDANRDGLVGLADLAALTDNYGKTNAEWKDGDFNSDGLVGLADLTALADNYGRTDPHWQGGGPASIPEPVTSLLLAIGACSVLFGRRR